MNTYNPRIADYQDAEIFMEQAVPQQNVCKCGKVIEHGNHNNPWCSLWCPEYQKTLEPKKAKWAAEFEPKKRHIDNTLFAQALEVVL